MSDRAAPPKVSKEWCLEMALREGELEVGAGARHDYLIHETIDALVRCPLCAEHVRSAVEAAAPPQEWTGSTKGGLPCCSVCGGWQPPAPSDASPKLVAMYGHREGCKIASRGAAAPPPQRVESSPAFQELLAAERALSDAYLRLRRKLAPFGSFETPTAPTGPQVWATTELALDKALVGAAPAPPPPKTCYSCETGFVRPTNVRGRSFDYRETPGLVIDVDLTLPVCDACGELWLRGEDSTRFSEVLERLRGVVLPSTGVSTYSFMPGQPVPANPFTGASAPTPEPVRPTIAQAWKLLSEQHEALVMALDRGDLDWAKERKGFLHHFATALKMWRGVASPQPAPETDIQKVTVSGGASPQPPREDNT